MEWNGLSVAVFTHGRILNRDPLSLLLLVTACFTGSNFDSDYYCAISSEVCADGMTFRTAHELYDNGTRDCRLCEAEDVAFVKGRASQNDGSRKAFAIAGIVFGSLVVLFGILFLLSWRRRLIPAPKEPNAEAPSESEPSKEMEMEIEML